MTVDGYLHQGKQLFTRWLRDRRVRLGLKMLAYGAAGFFASALGLLQSPMPFAMALSGSFTGWRAAAAGLGSILGYLIFWGRGGIQGMVWTLASTLTALFTGKSRMVRQQPLLLPAANTFYAAALGLIFQIRGFDTPTGVYLLRVALAGTASRIFTWLLAQEIPTVRRGETGLAQLRLERMAEALTQTRLALLEAEEIPIDEAALLTRTRERACGSCPNRRACHAPAQLPVSLLHESLTENASLPFFCRKPGRMVLEIRRTQEQYRLLKGDRQRRREYRAAVSQQYIFLSEFLRSQSAQLTRRSRPCRNWFTPEVGWAARSREVENGDRFRHFAGPEGQYFLLLCDGMGTGIGAAEEGDSAVSLLQRMLTAGFPAEHALESLHSLLALRGRAGAVTVDLAVLYLNTGAAMVYKWGAAPSYLLKGGAAEKIGTAGPPPGIRGWDVRQQRQRLSLRRGEWLILLSDGAEGEEVRRRAVTMKPGSAGEMAEKLLEAGSADASDDATAAVVRLRPPGMLT